MVGAGWEQWLGWWSPLARSLRAAQLCWRASKTTKTTPSSPAQPSVPVPINRSMRRVWCMWCATFMDGLTARCVVSAVRAEEKTTPNAKAPPSIVSQSTAPSLRCGVSVLR